MQSLQLNNTSRKLLFLFFSIVLSVLLLSLKSCRSHVHQNTATVLPGKWQIVDWQMPNLPAEDIVMQHMIQKAGAGPDKFGYMEFKTDGQLIMSIMGQSEVVTYHVSGDTIIINNGGGQSNPPMLMQFDSEERVSISTLNNDKVYVLQRMTD